MSYLRIQKDGLFEYEWDRESQTYVSEAVAQSRTIACLRMSCRIDEGVTLGEIFRLVNSYPALMAFIAEYSWCWSINEFHKQAILPAIPDTGEKLTHIEVSRYVEIDEEDFNDYLDLSAIGAADEHGHRHYGLSFSPMNSIAHLPVKLNTTASIFKNHEKVSEVKCLFTLLDVLDAIYDDISFHGGPEETAELGQELRGMVADIEAGTATLTPLEDVLGKDTVN